MIIEKLPFLEDMLSEWKDVLGADYEGYKNHLYRVLHFCFAFKLCSEEEKKKLIIASVFHDIAVWSQKRLDYLEPSAQDAKDYLKRENLETWSEEIEQIIIMHHKITSYKDKRFPLVELFRKADWVDASQGFRKFGLSKSIFQKVRMEFPVKGFFSTASTPVKLLKKKPLKLLSIFKF